jgi:hypothetical protein
MRERSNRLVDIKIRECYKIVAALTAVSDQKVPKSILLVW